MFSTGPGAGAGRSESTVSDLSGSGLRSQEPETDR